MRNVKNETRTMTADEMKLEDMRLLILGGITVVADFDADDLPIAGRIGAVQAMHG